MKKSIILLSVILISACEKPAIEVSKQNNSEIKLELLFEKDGCKMYRFEDGGQNIYWSQCVGGTIQNIYHSNGKNGGYYSRVKEITTQQNSL